ncbi:ABC transporter C family member 3 [Vitis vinifera]|uniref:ABC-type xenobiotic transporter n=1 Tax=Vitis vinifera TaxID=29760 RepID=A0A438K0Q6_VITVI|nr:ABC transporter C family member 3 [Vitis vinifera]
MVGAEAMVTYPGIGFLLNPIFLRAFSASLHLVLLLLLFVSWVCKRIKGSALENCKSTRNGWSDEKLVTLLDLVLRTLAWGAVCVYLHTQFHDIVKKHQSLPIQFLVPDIVYVITDLEGVPQLDTSNSVVGIFPAFRNKFQCDSGGSSGVTTLKLVKALISCLSVRHWLFRLEQIGIRIRAVLITMIYNKGLTLSCQSKQGHTTGEIINFMSVDAERIGGFSWYMHDPWILIMQVALALLILYRNLGLASVAAFFETVIVMLTNVPLGKWKEKFQDKLMESKDKRMKATSEILRNMRILKLQGWEMKFLSKIMDLRKNETGWLKKYLYTLAMTTFVLLGAPTFVSVVTFGTCMLLGIPLESGKILSSIATFRILQQPIYHLPDLISAIAQTKVSLDRIASFLCLDDLQSDVIERLPKGSSDTAIEIVDGNFSWDLSSPNPTLKDINLRVCRGMRVSVCGTVGSGKSSLLSCMLGEVPKISGILKLCGTKAYVAQSPWIQSGKIEENILFGKEMDRERYERVLDACSLKKDLEALSFGDQTVIGERGINLSGGQKQRIQIARALYQNTDIYLFDDPFSAVDARTETHLFKECLLGLLGSKTVIYVTHQVEFLPTADLILVVKDGMITRAGKGRVTFRKLSIHEDSDNIGGTSEVVEKEENKGGQNGKAEGIDGPKGQLVQEEEREKGEVGLRVYWKYIRTAYGGALVPFILLSQILFQLLQIGSNYWMAWASPVSDDVKPAVRGSTLMIVYVALAVGSSFCVLSRAMLLVTASYKTATIVFNKMHLSLFRAPMSFFDATPSGRILNRASTDQNAIDTNIPMQVGAFAFSLIRLLAIIAVMSQVAWQVFIVFIPVIATCIWYQIRLSIISVPENASRVTLTIHGMLMFLSDPAELGLNHKHCILRRCQFVCSCNIIIMQQYYISSARELSRLARVCKAPVIQHFSETISGSMTVVRSFDQESRFKDTNMKLVDGYLRPKFNIAGAMEWLCFRLDMLSSVTFAFSLVFLISVPEGVIDPGIAGLAVTYRLTLNMLQFGVIWSLCNTENKIISVERILQYTSIPSEPPLVIEENRPACSWPSYGQVDIQDLQVIQFVYVGVSYSLNH